MDNTKLWTIIHMDVKKLIEGKLLHALRNFETFFNATYSWSIYCISLRICGYDCFEGGLVSNDFYLY